MYNNIDNDNGNDNGNIFYQLIGVEKIIKWL